MFSTSGGVPICLLCLGQQTDGLGVDKYTTLTSKHHRMPVDDGPRTDVCLGHFGWRHRYRMAILATPGDILAKIFSRRGLHLNVGIARSGYAPTTRTSRSTAADIPF